MSCETYSSVGDSANCLSCPKGEVLTFVPPAACTLDNIAEVNAESTLYNSK